MFFFLEIPQWNATMTAALFPPKVKNVFNGVS
jgi:hypothetical protein